MGCPPRICTYDAEETERDVDDAVSGADAAFYPDCVSRCTLAGWVKLVVGDLAGWRRGWGTGDWGEEEREESEEAVGRAHGVCMYGDAGKGELFWGWRVEGAEQGLDVARAASTRGARYRYIHAAGLISPMLAHVPGISALGPARRVIGLVSPVAMSFDELM